MDRARTRSHPLIGYCAPSPDANSTSGIAPASGTSTPSNAPLRHRPTSPSARPSLDRASKPPAPRPPIARAGRRQPPDASSSPLTDDPPNLIRLLLWFTNPSLPRPHLPPLPRTTLTTDTHIVWVRGQRGAGAVYADWGGAVLRTENPQFCPQQKLAILRVGPRHGGAARPDAGTYSSAGGAEASAGSAGAGGGATGGSFGLLR